MHFIQYISLKTTDCLQFGQNTHNHEHIFFIFYAKIKINRSSSNIKFCNYLHKINYEKYCAIPGR